MDKINLAMSMVEDCQSDQGYTLTLDKAPKGFLARAEYRNARDGEWYLDNEGQARKYTQGTRSFHCYIILTRDWVRYHREDDVATFEEATHLPTEKGWPVRMGLGRRSVDLIPSWHHEDVLGIQWVKRTKCEE